MNNCLITTLKEEVNNPNLPVLNHIRFRVNNASYASMKCLKLLKDPVLPHPWLTFYGNVIAKALPSGTIYQNTTAEVPFLNTTSQYTNSLRIQQGTKDGGYIDFIVNNDPAIRGYCPKPIYLDIDKSIRELYAYDSAFIINIMGNGVTIAGNPKLSEWMALMAEEEYEQYVEEINLVASNIEGDVTNGALFGKYIGLTTLSVKATIDPDAAATAMVTEGRTTGTMTINAGENGKWRITFDSSVTGGYTKEAI